MHPTKRHLFSNFTCEFYASKTIAIAWFIKSGNFRKLHKGRALLSVCFLSARFIKCTLY